MVEECKIRTKFHHLIFFNKINIIQLFQQWTETGLCFQYILDNLQHVQTPCRFVRFKAMTFGVPADDALH
jgi:hypothetical protein